MFVVDAHFLLWAIAFVGLACSSTKWTEHCFSIDCRQMVAFKCRRDNEGTRDVSAVHVRKHLMPIPVPPGVCRVFFGGFEVKQCCLFPAVQERRF